MPFHPMIVHFPIVIAIGLPLIMIAVIMLIKKSEHHRNSWRVIFALCFILSVFSFVAHNAGENEEEKVEKIISEATIEKHAEVADIFTWATLLPLVFSGLLMFKNQTPLKVGAVLSALLVAGLVIKVGHAGAELVYKHNAGRIYSINSPAGGKGNLHLLPKGERHDRDDDDD